MRTGKGLVSIYNLTSFPFASADANNKDQGQQEGHCSHVVTFVYDTK